MFVASSNDMRFSTMVDDDTVTEGGDYIALLDTHESAHARSQMDPPYTAIIQNTSNGRTCYSLHLLQLNEVSI
jgi:hypothetical protein